MDESAESEGSTQPDESDTAGFSVEKKSSKKYTAPRPPRQKTDGSTKSPEPQGLLSPRTVTPEIKVTDESEKSPLAMRNISRIDDRRVVDKKPKKIQPKYGWL